MAREFSWLSHPPNGLIFYIGWWIEVHCDCFLGSLLIGSQNHIYLPYYTCKERIRRTTVPPAVFYESCVWLRLLGKSGLMTPGSN